MKDVAEQRRLFEKEHEEVKAQLRQRQDEIATLHRSKEAEKKKSAESIEILEVRINYMDIILVAVIILLHTTLFLTNV